jgi:hypothetical protein
VVAHSHGGNVALHATRRLARSKRVRTASLATPYLFAREGKPSTADTVVSSLVAIYVFGLLLVVALGPDKPMGNAWSLPLSVLAGAALLLRFTSWAFFRLVHGSPRDAELTQRLLAEVQVPSALGGDRDNDLLVIRAADDEAGGLLAFAQFSGWVSFTAARFARPIPLILGLWVGSFLLYAAESWLSGDDGGMGSVSGFLADWTFVVFSTCVLLLAFPLVCSLAHGWDGPAVSRFALVTAEASPPGATTVWQCAIRASRANGLAHASLYDEPEVIARTVDHVLGPV